MYKTLAVEIKGKREEMLVKAEVHHMWPTLSKTKNQINLL